MGHGKGACSEVGQPRRCTRLAVAHSIASMSVNAWLQEFRALHKRARHKQLKDEEEKQLYLQAREQFARALTAAQGMTLKPGEMARQTFRVAQAMQIELSLNTGIVRAMTLDISKGGFSVVLGKPPAENEMVGFTLKMPDGMDPIIGRAKLVASKSRSATTGSRSRSTACLSTTRSGWSRCCSTQPSRASQAEVCVPGFTQGETPLGNEASLRGVAPYWASRALALSHLTGTHPLADAGKLQEDAPP